MLEIFLNLKKKIQDDSYEVEIACDNETDYYLTMVNTSKDGGGTATYPFSKDELKHLYDTIAEILNK
jgi:hypothetical protein